MQATVSENWVRFVARRILLRHKSFVRKWRTTNLGPFGEVIRATGQMAKDNPFRFSTKYQDDETDLIYHGYRYYKPSTGDWLSRDPIDEPGFGLLRGSGTSKEDIPEYDMDELDGSLEAAEFEGAVHELTFVNNDRVNDWDMLGMTSGRGSSSSGPTTTAAAKKPKKKKPYKVKNVKITFYCNCKICTGKSPGDPGYGDTASGKKACKGTIAAEIPEGIDDHLHNAGRYPGLRNR